MRQRTKNYHLDAEGQARFDGCLRLAYKFIHRFVRVYGIDFDDAESHGLERLWRAAACFDPARGFQFTTYAAKCVRNGLIVLVQWQQLRRHIRAVPFSSLRTGEEDGRRDFDPTDRRTSSPLHQAEANERQAAVRALVERIADRVEPWERHLWKTLWDYHIEGKTARQIAQQDGVCEKAVYFRLDRGVQLFRERFPELVVGKPIVGGRTGGATQRPSRVCAF